MLERPDLNYPNRLGTTNALGNNRYFDPKMGALTGLVMGGIVYCINSEYGTDAASIAAAKQFTYTFLAGGILTRICENLATSFKRRNIRRVMSVLVPSLLTVGATYLVHSVRGTPEPLESTIPTMILAPPAFTFWSHRKRRQLEDLL